MDPACSKVCASLNVVAVVVSSIVSISNPVGLTMSVNLDIVGAVLGSRCVLEVRGALREAACVGVLESSDLACVSISTHIVRGEVN